MSALCKRALEHPELVRAFAEHGAKTWYTSMQEIAEYRSAQQARLAPLIRASGARVD